MSKRDKLLKKFFAEKPPVDITWAELSAVSDIFGCVVTERTNHRAVVHPNDPKWIYPVPVHSEGHPIKRAYIVELRKKFLELNPEVLNEI